ncbi:hypothetical protein GGTG_02989 [Gaeumannomyces tritici R3-111a-1]|uniref:Uncharacterized protein n=1 Tax=Gaeumannomyces tritici (strain R3-111a-1) TaxID=644352 RepID=J3NNY3_GAET3|nr:hypothetical protein GGTG_02989 [Gaeumannomyces tritici R3-111a-1]EJT77886.1 hypothetical protein GGTG_02989 [Gaeumannomyces tritici R3-111a-1]
MVLDRRALPSQLTGGQKSGKKEKSASGWAGFAPLLFAVDSGDQDKGSRCREWTARQVGSRLLDPGHT